MSSLTAIPTKRPQSSKFSCETVGLPRFKPSSFLSRAHIASTGRKQNPFAITREVTNIEIGHRHVLRGVGHTEAIRSIHQACRAYGIRWATQL